MPPHRPTSLTRSRSPVRVADASERLLQHEISESGDSQDDSMDPDDGTADHQMMADPSRSFPFTFRDATMAQLKANLPASDEARHMTVRITFSCHFSPGGGRGFLLFSHASK